MNLVGRTLTRFAAALVLGAATGIPFTSGSHAGHAAASICSGASVRLYDTFNSFGVSNGPPLQPGFSISAPICVTAVATYHWNYGQGALPGTITLQRVVGAQTINYFLPAYGTCGQGGSPPATDWITTCAPFVIPAGTYYVDDSSHPTWSFNAQNGNQGFVRLYGMGAPASALPPRPFPGSVPPPAVPPPAVPPACHGSTYADWELEAPPFGNCAGPVGTRLNLYVLRTIPARMASVVFKAGPHAYGHGVRAPWGWQLPPVPLQLIQGNGVSAGSSYSVAAPPGLCAPGRGYWGWDMYILYQGSTMPIDDEDYFLVQCP